MNFSTQEMEELVPEATLLKCPDKPAGEVFMMRNKEGNQFSILKSNPFWLKLVESRYKLEKVNSVLQELINYKLGEDSFGFLDAIWYRGAVAEAIEIIEVKNEHSKTK